MAKDYKHNSSNRTNQQLEDLEEPPRENLAYLDPVGSKKEALPSIILVIKNLFRKIMMEISTLI